MQVAPMEPVFVIFEIFYKQAASMKPVGLMLIIAPANEGLQ